MRTHPTEGTHELKKQLMNWWLAAEALHCCAGIDHDAGDDLGKAVL